MVLKSFNLVQTIQGYTRIARKGDLITKTTVDVCITNCYSDFTDCSILDEVIGDHQVIKCVLDFQVKKADKFKKIDIRDHSSQNIDEYCDALGGCSFLQIMQCNDVEDGSNKLNDILNNHYEISFPIKSIRTHPNYLYKPSKEFLKAIRLKRKLYRKFKRLLDRGSSSCMNAWENFKIQRNLVTKLSKRNTRSNIVNDLKDKSIKNDNLI